MGQIDLQVYLGQIDRLLEENRLAEAAAHCRQILERYPRHVDTYRLLGRALLEQQQYADAVDIFSRVLSTIPDDLVAHVGVAEALKDRGNEPTASLHLERALELDPHNRAIREELNELIDGRGGSEHQGMGLTQAILARTYFRGALYQEAAAELRALLSQDSDRMDLLTLLAETLWKDGRRLEAVKVAVDVLAKLPNCIKANAILADIWVTTDQRSEALKCLERVRDLTLLDASQRDPNTLLGLAFSHSGGLGLPERVLIEELEYLPIGAHAGGNGPDWVQEFVTAPAPHPGEPSWYQDKSGTAAGIAGVAQHDSDSDDDVLDWLRAVAETESDLFGAEEGAVSTSWTEQGVEGESPGSDVPSEPFELPEESPENAIGPDTTIEDIDVVSTEPVSDVSDATTQSDWLDELTDNQVGVAGAPDEFDDPSPIVDPFSNAAQAVEEAGPGEDAPEFQGNWLNELAASAGESDEAPDWLYETVGFSEEVDLGGLDDSPGWLAASTEDTDQDSNDVPPWLLAAAGLAAGAAKVGKSVERPLAPENLDHSEPDPSEPEDIAGLAAVVTSDVNDDEFSEWLVDSHEGMEDQAMGVADDKENDQQDSPEGMDDAMKWLEELAAEQKAPAEELSSAPESIGDSEQSQIESAVPDETEENSAEDVQPVAAETVSDSSPDEDIEELDPAPVAATLVGAAAIMTDDGDDDGAVDKPSEESANDDLSWLDQIAAGEGAAIDEPPTMSWEEDQGDPLAELDPEPVDELSWLAQLETLGDEPVESGIDSGLDVDAGIPALSEELGGLPFETGNGPEELAEDLIDDVPEDPDDAMAWLEQLAAKQGVPAEELPSIDQFETGMDDSEAVPEFETAEPAPLPSQAEVDLDEMLAEPVDFEMPRDDEEALTWLNEFATAAFMKSALTAAPADFVADEMPTPATAHDVLEARAEAETLIVQQEADVSSELLDEVPDDPDDAMAWLEQLAVRQGAASEELVSVESEADEFEIAEGMEFDQVEKPEIEATLVAAESTEFELDFGPDVGAAEPATDDIEVILAEPEADTLDMEQMESESESPAVEPGETEPEQLGAIESTDLQEGEDDFLNIGSELAQQDVGDSLPDWLNIEPEAETGGEELDWLDALAEPSEDSWLEAEESATKTDIQVPEIDFGYDPEPAEPAELEPAISLETESEIGEIPDSEPVEATADLDPEQLSLARSALEAGDLDGAQTGYRALLEQGEGLPYLIVELESAVESHSHTPALRRLLGDAYARNGQMQKALEAYRLALDDL